MRTDRRLLSILLLLLSVVSTADAQQLIEPRGVSLDQAVDMVQRRYGARAVKAETVSQGDRRVHKIRLLSPEGRVWNVHVDAQTGATN
jgi:uncharacterized membrane protein YkoI